MFRQKPPFLDRNSDYSHFRCHFLHRSHRQPKLLLSVVQFDVILPRVGFFRTKIGLSPQKNLICGKIFQKNWFFSVDTLRNFVRLNTLRKMSLRVSNLLSQWKHIWFIMLTSTPSSTPTSLIRSPFSFSSSDSLSKMDNQNKKIQVN